MYKYSGATVTILRTPRDIEQEATEAKHFLLQGLQNRNLKALSMGGLGQYVY